jgi:hypothetical protein
MSRLEEECIFYIGRNRSGIDSGEIDYGIFMSKFERMSVGCLEDALKSLNVIETRIKERIEELQRESSNETN